MAKRWLVQIAYLLLAGIALAQAGCLGLAIGGAVGGAAAGYAIYQGGQWARDCPAPLNNVTAALKTALAELQLPLVSEKRDADEISIESRTGDDAKISIQLKAQASRIPADGASTHVVIRVGNFGDQALSMRVLDQISLHLTAPVVIHPPTATLAPPHESAPPPLAK